MSNLSLMCTIFTFQFQHIQNKKMLNDTDPSENSLPTIERIHYAYFFSSLIIFAPIVIGNSLILICLYRFRELRSPMGLLIGSLSTSDLLVGLILIPTDILKIVLEVRSNKYVCLFSIGTSVVLLGSSILNLLAISMERYISVVHPLRHRGKKTMTITKWFIPVMWASCLVIGYLPLMGLNKFEQGQQCIYKNVFFFGYTLGITAFFTTCIFVNIVLFIAVVRIALSKLRSVKHSALDFKQLRISRNLTKTYVMMAVSATFIICWGPFSVLCVIGIFHQWEEYPTCLRWSFFFGFLNSGINWMIYGFRNPKFRKAIQGVVACSSSRASVYISHS